ncbi:pentapeptide repeat-containing protein [Streptomyces marokkonensis]|uniref:Pentapeptide repeat-containing protein n=1 Tax=Streptomyces marokkonensis TaxID=324855 RepID=A0ABW6QIP4_9ACTN
MQHAEFFRAVIHGKNDFTQAHVEGEVDFRHVEFGGEIDFRDAEFGGDAIFRNAVLQRAASMGPLMCAGTLDLSEAVFERAVTIETAAKTVRCSWTRWASTAALRLRHAKVDLSDAVLEFPVSISARARPFIPFHFEMREPPELADPRVRAQSLRGVDAAHLVLTDIDLTDCRFAVTIHPDQLRLEGRCLLAATPSGLHRRGLWPVRWAPRRILAEEHHWRAARAGTDAGIWTVASGGEQVLEPAALAPVYRQLRKAFEDGKDEPGAADFYYGEMEMRRHDTDTPRAERALLAVYWALSGYGLRAACIACSGLVAGSYDRHRAGNDAVGSTAGDSASEEHRYSDRPQHHPDHRHSRTRSTRAGRTQSGCRLSGSRSLCGWLSTQWSFAPPVRS